MIDRLTSSKGRSDHLTKLTSLYNVIVSKNTKLEREKSERENREGGGKGENERHNCSATVCMLLLIDDLMYLHVTSQDQLFVSNRVPLETLEKCHVALRKIFEKDMPSPS